MCIYAAHTHFYGKNMCIERHSWNTCVVNKKWIMDKFKPFPQVFKYFNETRKKYWKKIFYASNVTLMSKKKKENSDLQEGLCWFLSWTVFKVEPVIIWTFLDAHSAISKSLIHKLLQGNPILHAIRYKVLSITEKYCHFSSQYRLTSWISCDYYYWYSPPET